MEFEQKEYRVLDAKNISHLPRGLVSRYQEWSRVILTVEVDKVAGTVRWKNDVDFDPGELYNTSKNLDDL